MWWIARIYHSTLAESICKIAGGFGFHELYFIDNVNSLIQKLNSVLTKRILRYLDEENKRDPDNYNKWYKEFGNFLKEGVISDYKWKEDISKLLR